VNDQQARITPEEREALISDYLSDDDDLHQCAWEDLNDLVASNPEVAWVIILRLIERTDHDLKLANIGAAQLEDIISRWGAQFRTRVIREMKSNKRFCRALRAAYFFSVPTDLLREISKEFVAQGDPIDHWERIVKGRP